MVDVDSASYALPEEFAERMLTPALAIYLDRVRHNLATVIRAAGGPDRWRPHVKTSKVPAVFAEVARAGIRHFKCATTREARTLLAALDAERAAEPDVLLAQPLVGPALVELGRIAAEHALARVSVLCEAPELVGTIPANVRVFVDVNPGMHRTGVPLADERTILAVARRAGERFGGIHFYDGHLHDADAARRERAAFACYDGLVALLEGFERASLRVPEVITSGTPTFLSALRYAGFDARLEGPTTPDLELARTVHRISPGTVVYHDLRTEELLPKLGLVPAALVHARVVSHPAPDIATCDAGSKSLAAEAGAPCAAVLGRPDLVALAPSEEHLPLHVLLRGERPQRGERLMLFPHHICPTVNLAEEAILVDDGCVVGVVPVAARAHDVLPQP